MKSGIGTSAVEIRLLAERQMGVFLREMSKLAGARGIGKSGVVRDDSTQTTLSARLHARKLVESNFESLNQITTRQSPL